MTAIAAAMLAHFLTISRERLPYVLPARSARFRQEATKC